MKEISIPIVDGKYKATFPQKCVYCGAPQELTMRETVSSESNRRRRFATLDVPYCSEHARESRRNSRVLTFGLITILLTSCCVLFGVTTSINRDPPTWILVFLAFIAVGLAFAGRELFRRIMARSIKTMGDMSGGSNLGLKVELAGNNLLFSFTNGRMADEFARLNGQSPD